MLRANYLGLGMFVVGGLLAGFASLVLHWSDPVVFIVVGSTLIVLDALARLRSRHIARWPISPEAGGHVLYVPMWVWGGVVLGINLIRAIF